MKWGRLTDVINNVKGLGVDSTFFFVFSMDHVQLFAIELNTGAPNISEYGQLFLHGIDANGTPLSEIGGDYSPITEGIKINEGLPIDRVTLYQEGDFYKSWDLMLGADNFTLKANTIKDGEDLQDRWGSDIIGLTNESIQKLSQEVLPEIIDHLISQILQ